MKRINTMKLVGAGVLSMVAAFSVGAAPLAYEGFSASVSGAGDDYVIDGSLRGQSDARVGFSGNWSSPGIAAGIGYELRDDNLSYSGLQASPNGVLEIFETRAGIDPPRGRSIGRSLSYATPDSDDIYFVFTWSTSDAIPVSINLIGSRDMSVAANASGVVSVTFEGASRQNYISAAGAASTTGEWNLVVIKVKDDPGGANPDFYDTADIWVNPTIVGGSLGIADGAGRGIIRDHNGGGIATSFTSVSFGTTIGTDEEVRFDDFYITTDVSDFLVIPEPGSLALVGVGGLLISRRRRG